MDLLERQYISQYANDVLGLEIQRAGVTADADGPVTLTMVREADPDGPATPVLSREATRVDEGHYEVTLASTESDRPGNYTLVWTYTFGGIEQEYSTYAVIGVSSPDFDRLSPDMKDLVEQVWVRFADLFDSPNGGPHLQAYFQAHFGRNRMAQLLRMAMGQMNTMSQPNMTYSLFEGQGAQFPLAEWGAVLEQATYIQAVKHLIRSYVEQPAFVGSGAVSRLDRRDYMDRWRMVLQDEQSMFDKQLETFKIAHMMLGRPRVLVSGGVYGRYGPTRVAGSIAARPRYWTRFY